MQIEQIIIRPKDSVLLLQHVDNAGRAGVTVIPAQEVDDGKAGALTALVGFCLQRLPPEVEQPSKSDLQQEIEELEYRLEHLRKSLA